MGFVLYNTLSAELEEFVPINPPQVNIYTCGVTVYDDSHVGHGRSLIVFDVFRRYLEKLGYRVKFVRNFTDIDDKIINKANEENKDFMSIANRYIARYYLDIEAINVKPANVEPRVTEHMEEIISLISKLIELGKAYESDGDVYFSIDSFKDYGKLSKRSPEELEAGARIEPSSKKRNPLDFALWKASKSHEPGWESPWSYGRPGWHTECVAMIFKHLGETIDIHAGGIDLVFPHHENEIAQAESITGKPFARYWMHNGLVTVGGKKMSKSLGNFVTLKEIYTKYHPDVLRLLVLFTHYRSPLDFSFEKMEETKKAYERLKSAIEDIEPLKAIAKEGKPVVDIDFYSLEKSTQEQFYKALSEDFNTSLAMAQVFNAVAELNRAKTESFKIGYITPKELEGYLFLANSLKQTLKDIFGLLEENTLQNTLKTLEPASSINISTEFLEILIKARNLAKENKDFKVADFIRDELLNHGIKLEDTKAGTIWKKL